VLAKECIGDKQRKREKARRDATERPVRLMKLFPIKLGKTNRNFLLPFFVFWGKVYSVKLEI
jgi:hypothetical protein